MALHFIVCFNASEYASSECSAVAYQNKREDDGRRSSVHNLCSFCLHGGEASSAGPNGYCIFIIRFCCGSTKGNHVPPPQVFHDFVSAVCTSFPPLYMSN